MEEWGNRHTCTHTHTCTYAHAHTHTHPPMHMHTHTHTHSHACTHTHKHTHACAHRCMRTHMHTKHTLHTHPCTCMHTHTHTPAYTHKHPPTSHPVGPFPLLNRLMKVGGSLPGSVDLRSIAEAPFSFNEECFPATLSQTHEHTCTETHTYMHACTHTHTHTHTHTQCSLVVYTLVADVEPHPWNTPSHARSLSPRPVVIPNEQHVLQDGEKVHLSWCPVGHVTQHPEHLIWFSAQPSRRNCRAHHFIHM